MYRVIRLFSMVAVFCFATNAGSADDRNTDVIIGVGGKRLSLPKDENSCIHIEKAEIDERQYRFPFLDDLLEIKLDDLGNTPKLVDVMCLKEDGEYRAVKIQALLDDKSTIQIITEPVWSVWAIGPLAESEELSSRIFSRILSDFTSAEKDYFMGYPDFTLADLQLTIRNKYPDAPEILVNWCCFCFGKRLMLRIDVSQAAQMAREIFWPLIYIPRV